MMGWMDRWMDGWVEVCVGGWPDGWKGAWLYGCVGGCVYEWVRWFNMCCFKAQHVGLFEPSKFKCNMYICMLPFQQLHQAQCPSCVLKTIGCLEICSQTFSLGTSVSRSVGFGAPLVPHGPNK